MIDLLSGLLASGGWGPTVGQIGGDLTKPYNASYLFIALDIAHFRSLGGFLDEARAAVERVRGARRTSGTARLYTPGEQSAEKLATGDGQIALSLSVAQTLAARARALGVPLPDFLTA
jgi:LDH2 family malate/lactate/ureidoglycolate dehydrogenase